MFVIYKGIPWTYRLTVTVKDSGALQDLTGIAITLTIKKHGGDPALITLTVGAGITLLAQNGATLGQADVVMTGVQTNSLNADVYELACVATVAGLDRLPIPPTAVIVRAI